VSIKYFPFLNYKLDQKKVVK